MLLRPPYRRAQGRKGVVLLAVLIVVVVLTLAAYQFSDMMAAESKAADSHRRLAQARALADSGIHYAAAMLANSDTLNNSLGGNPFSNQAAFQGVLVQDSDQPRKRGRFSLIAALSPDDPQGGSQPYRFGVIDESGKLNLNALFKLDSSGQSLYNILMTLPNMTDDVANSILDWMDPTSTTPRPNGAKDEYYMTLPTPYHCKNGPFDSLEELLLVKGVTPELLFGNDLNRNGILDPEEDDGSGVLDQGWSAYLTVYSRELNVDSQGMPRVYINDPDVQNLSNNLTNVLPSDLANYIVAYRIYGPASSQQGGGAGAGGAAGMGGQRGGQGGGQQGGQRGGQQGGARGGATGGAGMGGGAGGAMGAGRAGAGAASGGAAGMGGSDGGGGRPAGRLSLGTSDFQKGGNRRIGSLYELINSQVAIPSPTASNPNATTNYPSPLNDPGTLQQELPTLLDETTTESAAELPARVNITTAPQAVLMALPGMSDTVVSSILDHRPSLDTIQANDPTFQTPAWLITEANLPPQTLQALEKYVTARTQVYRVQAVGYFDGGGPAARVEAVIDTNLGRPRIVSWRDLTELGKGFDLPTPQQ